MARRSRAGGSARKGRGSSAAKRKIPTKNLRRKRSLAELQEQLERRTAELKEAREQQTATADVLKVISRSTFDLNAVLQTLVESAARLCEAEMAFIHRREGEQYRAAATFGFPPEFWAFMQDYPINPGRGSIAGRVALERQAIQIEDVAVDPEYTLSQATSLAQQHTTLGVPLLRENELVGVIVLARRRVELFTEKQVALVTTFADQAVIAIENTRLFENVQQRTRDLQESLNQQTATAEILATINASTGDLEPVFDAILKKAHALCGVNFGSLQLYDGERIWAVTVHGLAEEFAEVLRRGFPANESPWFQAALEGHRHVHILDAAKSESAVMRTAARMAGIGTTLFVPMRKESRLLGAIVGGRREVRSFSEQEIGLLENFAAQAALAIENARLFNETKEALERQTATADVLKVISRSTFDLRVVLDTLLWSAGRLCEADMGVIARRQEGRFYRTAAFGLPDNLRDLIQDQPVELSRDSGSGRALLEGKVIQIADIEADPEYTHISRGTHAFRALLAVPMMREGAAVGVMTLMRKHVEPFTDKQIELVSTFADQAAIAIENVRLFDEVQAKTRDLEESLQQQTATAEVLKVISRSAFDLLPVLETLVETAAQLCDADMAFIMRRDGDFYRAGAAVGFTDEYIEFLKDRPLALDRGSITGRAVLERRTVQILDVAADPEYTLRESTKMAGQRTALGVPLLRENEPIGVIVIARKRVQAFTDKQIELVSTFADQAVIAIENARLFNETKESLERQTATADVLKVISQSSVDLETVLDTLVQTVARLCRADQVYMFHLRHELWHLIADCGLSAEAREFFQTHPFTPGRGSTPGRAALERRAILIPDVLQDPEYTLSEGQEIAGYRTTLGIPLLREDALVGVYGIARTRVEPFTDKEIELASSFADQAVIAIENARLFDELRERQAELRVTFDNMGDGVAMFGADRRLAAWNRNWQEMLDLPNDLLIGRPSFAELFRYLAARGEFGSADLEAELSRSLEDTTREMRYERTRPDGRIIEVRRNSVPEGGFVLIYADITERKRAEEAIRGARDAAEKALRDLQTAQDRLVQTEKLASLGQLTAGIAHEIKNPLNFVNNFAALSVELADELKGVLKPAALHQIIRSEVDEITGLLKDNLEKVVQHGKRADSIVRNMLLHSREGSGERRSADVNALVGESLNLAYHGARAEKPGFAITLKHDLDPNVGALELYPQEMTRALLNLISNGFYAATARKANVGNAVFEPILTATTRGLDETVEIRIRDNGCGISPEVRARMFDPFFTTKPTGEGTGLGLSMTHDIIVKQHGGRIDVETEPGVFTEFIITLPRGNGPVMGERSE